MEMEKEEIHIRFVETGDKICIGLPVSVQRTTTEKILHVIVCALGGGGVQAPLDLPWSLMQ